MTKSIDIRGDVVEQITQIQFADPSSDGGYYGTTLEYAEGLVVIIDEDGDWCGKIKTKQDAENLIKALQKAIELNWWEV